jgi:hypothetical protein
MNFNDFLVWEASTKDTIDFKKIYVDIAGDLNAGLVLSEIVYWYLPSRETGTSKLRVQKNGKFWMARRRYEWWDRTRMTPKQADTAISKLIEAGLIEKDRFKFKGEPTVHIRILEENFLDKLDATLRNPTQNPFLPKGEKPNVETVENGIPIEAETFSPSGVTPYTESLSVNPSKYYRESVPPEGGAGNSNNKERNAEEIAKIDEAIAQAWQTTGPGRIANLRQTLLGLHLPGSEHYDSNITPPARPIEIKYFGDYFRRQNPLAKMPTVPFKLQDWFYKSRQLKWWVLIHEGYMIVLDVDVPHDFASEGFSEQILEHLKKYEVAEYNRVTKVIQHIDSNLEPAKERTILHPVFYYRNQTYRLPILLLLQTMLDYTDEELDLFLQQHHSESYEQMILWRREIDRKLGPEVSL